MLGDIGRGRGREGHGVYPHCPQLCGRASGRVMVSKVWSRRSSVPRRHHFQHSALFARWAARRDWAMSMAVIRVPFSRCNSLQSFLFLSQTGAYPCTVISELQTPLNVPEAGLVAMESTSSATISQNCCFLQDNDFFHLATMYTYIYIYKIL